MGHGIQFDMTITLGTLLQIAGTIILAIAAWSAFKTKVELIMKQQQELLNGLTNRFTAHEQRDEKIFDELQKKITDLVGGVSRLVGQNEVFRRNEDRRGA